MDEPTESSSSTLDSCGLSTAASAAPPYPLNRSFHSSFQHVQLTIEPEPHHWQPLTSFSRTTPLRNLNHFLIHISDTPKGNWNGPSPLILLLLCQLDLFPNVIIMPTTEYTISRCKPLELSTIFRRGICCRDSIELGSKQLEVWTLALVLKFPALTEENGSSRYVTQNTLSRMHLINHPALRWLQSNLLWKVLFDVEGRKFFATHLQVLSRN